MTMWIRPLSSARSDRGRIGRCRSAIIAVLVTRGSTTMSVVPGLASSRRHRIGWLSAMFAPMSRITSALLEVLVRAGRSVAAKRSLVAGDGRRHAERRVAVVVARAEPELHELAERVELLGHELAGADHADGVGAVLRLHLPETRRHRRERVRPADAARTGRALPLSSGYAGAVVGRRACGARRGPSGRACRGSRGGRGCRGR